MVSPRSNWIYRENKTVSTLMYLSSNYAICEIEHGPVPISGELEVRQANAKLQLSISFVERPKFVGLFLQTIEGLSNKGILMHVSTTEDIRFCVLQKFIYVHAKIINESSLTCNTGKLQLKRNQLIEIDISSDGDNLIDEFSINARLPDFLMIEVLIIRRG